MKVSVARTGTAVILGASSGIGYAVAEHLLRRGYASVVMARRLELLQALSSSYAHCFAIEVDALNTAALVAALKKAAAMLNGIDLLFISAGAGEPNPDLNFELEKGMIDLNVTAFTAAADWGFRHFRDKQSGHLAAISSVAGHRGNRESPAYSATKAYQQVYLEGLRQKATQLRLSITVTDVRPGYVDTKMAKGPGIFWMSSVQKAAAQIDRALVLKRPVVYVSRRWRFVALLMRAIPGWLWKRL